MEITLTMDWSSDSLAWHYHEVFWAGARRNLSDFDDQHELDEMVRLFDTIIEYCATDVLSVTTLNDIIWFDWDTIMQLYNGEEE